MVLKPTRKPSLPYFSSGPCAKRPGWSPAVLGTALLGRSHRSPEGCERLTAVIERTKSILRLPPDYEVALVPGSDTGAFELAMWNLLGARGADVFAWDVFGRIWLKDALDELKLAGVRTFDAGWGELPDLQQADFSRDVIFAWNGTTSGVKIPSADWIAADRTGLVFADATSAIFAEDIDYSKVDVLTYSWQKALGGEAAHGMLILSPRAMQRLRDFQPAWPIPKVFRLKNNGTIAADIFAGVTINTPSMLCVEDYLDALAWIESIGGLAKSIARARDNAAVIYGWLDKSAWAAPLARVPATRSHTSVCLRFSDPDLARAGAEEQRRFALQMADLLAREGVAFDIASYRGVTPGLRIWTGTTIARADLEALIPWLDWAFATVKADFSLG